MLRRQCVIAALVGFGVAYGRPCRAQSRPDLLTANIDSSVSPRDDFYQFAVGAWLLRTAIPDGQPSVGIGGGSNGLKVVLARSSESAAAAHARPGTLAQLIGDFWFTGMDSATINRQGLAPLRPDLARIDAIRTLGDVIEMVAVLHRRDMLLDGASGFVGSRTLFYSRVEQDQRQSSRRLLVLRPGGNTIGAQAYTATSGQPARMRAALRTYLFNTFSRLGHDSTDAQRRAEAVFDLESRIARGIPGVAEYHVMGRAELRKLSPAIDWDRYFRDIGVPKLDSVGMPRPQFFEHLDTVLRATPLDVWKDYLRYCLVRAHAPFLDDSTYHDFFAVDSVRGGMARPRPRWERVVWQEQFWLGQPTQDLMARDIVPAEAVARTEAIAESLRVAFRDRIARLDWMSDSTKRQALVKLDKLRIILGLVGTRADFSTMHLRRDSYVLNMIRSAEWFHEQKMKQLARPVDPAEADLEYNVGGDAYYDVNANAVFLPQAGVAAGVNDADLDDAFIYGSTLLGHEISHAFDSNGRYFDAFGNRTSWWTPADSVAFDRRAQTLVDEYNEFEPVPGVRVNGRGSLAENMADLVGVRLALDAFEKTDEYRGNQPIAGFTPLQRFFLAYAYIHACKEQPAFLAFVARGNYAPCRERVNGVVMNIPEFYEAFEVRPADRMYRAQEARATIW